MMFVLDTHVVSELRKVRLGKADLSVAATALVHGMTLVTRNVADFKPTGVTLLNPWEAQQ